MKKKYLVTGGTGFLGSALVRALVGRGDSVRVFDNNFRGNTGRIKSVVDKVELHEGDIRDAATVRKAVHGVDSVLHLAYVNGTELFYQIPDVIVEVAIKGMLNVLEACRDENVKEFVLASSSEVYQTPPRIPTDENVPLVIPDIMNPRFSYGGGKIACELMLVNLGRTYLDRAIIFRPHNVYGPDMGNEHVVPQFIARMRQAHDSHPMGTLEFPIQGNGTETRSFVYIDDFTDALLKVIDKGEHLGVYHIGSGEEISVTGLATHVAEAFGRKIQVVPGKLQPGSTSRRCPDITKLKGLGFEPRVSLAEGVKRSVKAFLEKK